MFLLRSIILFNLFVLLNTNCTLAQDYEIDLDAGQEVFINNCAACHANGENTADPAKTLKFDILESNSMNSISAITYQVNNGKNGMPAFGNRLSDEEIQNVANYVLNQSSKNLW
uniref:Cytochrome c-553 n=1 Tax=Thuretia quercifolia TaxID=189650 RepID=A0A1Z1MJT1_9FLOR|nr:cytochrome c553 [Thuretia quercifolia]ARW66327.1 cytochrome c553 [Thuretia quercifolia]